MKSANKRICKNLNFRWFQFVFISRSFWNFRNLSNWPGNQSDGRLELEADKRSSLREWAFVVIFFEIFCGDFSSEFFFQDFFHSFSLVISLVVPVKILTRDLCCDLSKLRVPSRIPVCPMVKLGLTNQLSFQWKHQNRNSEQKTHCLQWSVENCLQKLISVWNSLFVNRFEFAKTFSELFVWFKPPSLVKAFRNSRKRVSREQLSVLLNVWRLYRDSHWDA